MKVTEMSYFATIDVQQAMAAIEAHRAKALRELNDLYHLVSGSEHAAAIDDAASALEALEVALSSLSEAVVARQLKLEEQQAPVALAIGARS
jgi:hypothetical protein